MYQLTVLQQNAITTPYICSFCTTPIQPLWSLCLLGNSVDDQHNLPWEGQSWSYPQDLFVPIFIVQLMIQMIYSTLLRIILMCFDEKNHDCGSGPPSQSYDQLTWWSTRYCWGQPWSCPRGLQVNHMINSPDDLPDLLCWGQSWSCPHVPWVPLCSSWTRL